MRPGQTLRRARETGTERPGWDDNNGWCGKPPFVKEKARPAEVSAAQGAKPQGRPTEILGVGFERSAAVEVAAAGAVAGEGRPAVAVLSAGGERAPEVLGAQFSRGALPTTGGASLAPTLLALFFLISGAVTLRNSNRR